MVILQPGTAAHSASASVTAKGPALGAGAGSMTVTASAPAAARHQLTFHELLSELNPLQYIPVIGTLFRALTGDTIPEPVRDAGSLVVSGMIAGPIGVAMNLGELAIEKVTGINPEKIEDKMLATIGIGHKSPAVPAPADLDAKAQIQDAAAQDALAWSPSQLAAYGVTTTPGGDLARGNLTGSDVLNSLELARIQAQYASTATARSG